MDRSLWAARHLVRLLWVLNAGVGIAFLVALALSFPLATMLGAHLTRKFGGGIDVAAVIAALRIMLAIGIVGSAALFAIFTALLAILETVRVGDPFTLANAARLRRIGWALLGIQFLDLAMGALTAWLTALRVKVPGWSPDIGGWVAVVMVFVLAGVFARGAAMRDDLAHTI